MVVLHCKELGSYLSPHAWPISRYCHEAPAGLLATSDVRAPLCISCPCPDVKIQHHKASFHPVSNTLKFISFINRKKFCIQVMLPSGGQSKEKPD